MENLSHSRHPNRSKKISGNAAAGTRSLYDDVYGGPPKFSAAAKTSLSPRMEDYSEIFGSFQASRASSIPVLDLPAVDESEVLFDVRSSGFDYAEVFGGGYEGLDYAVSYEDLVNGDSSSEAWSPAEFESMSEESDASGKDQTFSNGGHRYQLDGSTEFSISYHQARQMSNEDVSNGMTHVAQVHAVPGYSFMVDSPSQLKEDEMTANGYLDMDFSAEMMKAKHVKATTTSSNGSTVGRGFGNDLRQPKGQDNDGPSSRNSFLDVSKISLRTQPFDLPPPARPPPMVGAKKGDSSKQRKTSAFEGIPGDSSPTFFDVEVDASSSAAVSAAAMKEAMEKAQAKLKSAKELMDKKKEGLQGSYKLGSKKHMKDKAGETAMFIEGSKMKDEKEKGTSEKDGGGAEFVSREEKKRASKTEVPGNFRREELRSPHKNHVEDKHKKESRSLSGSSKIDETNECKEATEFFELVTTVEPQKDFEQANCEKISVHNVHIKQHKPKAKRGMETSEKQSGNGMNVNTDIEDHELEEFGERKKAQELSRPMEHNVKSKEASEMKVRGKNLQPSHVVCEGVENKMDSATAKQHSASNKRITEADKSVDEEETSTHHTPITCYNEGSSETLETVEETRAHENAETLNNEVLLGAVESKNEFLDKSFEASGTTNDGVMSDAREPLSSDHSVKKTSGEIKRKPNATDDSGVFEIEDLLSENLKDFGKLQEFLDASELSHLDNQVKDSIEVGSVIREPCEQIQSFSPKGSDSIRQAREFAHECKESGEDLTQAQVSLNQEKQGRESGNRWVETGEDVTVSLSQEEKEGSMPTQVGKESKEAQPTMGEQKQMNQKPVQQVDASQTTEVKEEAYVEVDTEKEVRTPELEDQRLRKGEEEQERESEMEREVKPRNQKSVQQVNASQTTEIEEKKYEEIDIEKEKRERELENIRLRKVDEEWERGREREGKPNNHKSVQQVKASKIIEIKEVYEEVDTEREKSERELENQRLQKVEEERISERDMEREKEVKPNNHKSVQQVKVSKIIEIKEFYEEVDTEREKSERELENQRLQKVEEERISERDMEREKEVKLKNQKSAQQVNASKTNETKEKTSEELGNEREKRERELLNQRLGKVEEEHERERDNEREREGKPKYQKSTEQVKASQTTERKDKASVEVETERMERERELDNERRRHIEEERKREDKQKNQKLAQQVNASKTTERKEKTPGEVETERIRREREMEIERLKRIEEDREREREREKDRMAVDLATLEARERALVESRERAERAAVERVTAEARQRAMTEARERLEKACAEATEKSLAGKTTTEARIRAERAAVERATAEARERAAERAVAERAAALEAKDRVQRSVSDKFSASSRNNGMRQSSSSSDLQDLHYQNSGVSEYQYSSVYGERYDGGEGESAQRCKAIFERHRRTAERGAKALAEKNMRDLLAQREQAERNRLAETLDADVRRWSSGKEGNLRALLSTLQYILGPDGGWQPIPLTEVITSAAVKKAYRKATLCVHPDKLQQRGASIQHKYICEKVFDLLKEAWNKFNSEER